METSDANNPVLRKINDLGAMFDMEIQKNNGEENFISIEAREEPKSDFNDIMHLLNGNVKSESKPNRNVKVFGTSDIRK